MMHLAALPVRLPTATFGYFDGVAAVWLVIGLFRGRKRGMSQEFLPMLQWVAIVVVAGLFYRRLADPLRQFASFPAVWANIFAYILIGFGVHLVYLWLKQAIGDRLVSRDLFGSKEYYLGMMAGVVEFACVLVAFCALMNARIITQAELAHSEQVQAENLADIRLPTFGTVQQAVLFHSYTGQLVEDRLQPVLITSTAPPPKHPTIAQKEQRTLDEVISGGKK